MGPANGGQPVGNHDRRAPDAHALERALDGGLRLVVHGGGGLVEHEDGRVLEDRARDREALSLAPRQLLTALAHHGVVALGQLVDEAVGLRDAGGLPDLLLARVRSPVGDVLAHRAVEQEDLLADEAHLAAEGREVELTEVDAPKGDAPLGRVVEAQEQLDHGRLAGARRADEGRGPTGLEVEVQPLEHARPGGVGEADPLEAQVLRPRTLSHLASPRRDPGRDVQQVQDARGRGHGALEQVEGLSEPGQRPEEPLGEEDHHRVGPHCHPVVGREVAAVGEGRREAAQDDHADER